MYLDEFDSKFDSKLSGKGIEEARIAFVELLREVDMIMELDNTD